MPDVTPEKPRILLLEGPDGCSGDLAARIAALGFEALRCDTIDAAERMLEAAEQPIPAVLLPAELADRRLKRALKGLRRRGPRGGLQLCAVGVEPEPEARKHLRAAGVTLALWQPFDDGTLRFQLNRATRSQTVTDVRGASRVPTCLAARVQAGARGRDAILYSLSENGAYLHTPRACMNGAHVVVEMRLPGGSLVVEGTVVFANVPGNLQKPNLPLGMGVRFCDVPDVERKVLRDYVATRLDQLGV